MTQAQHPVPVGEPEWERGLWAMVAASGVLHVLAIALVIVIPHTFLHRPPALKSYTVDLIAPDHVGGTNMIAGGKGRMPGPPMAVAPKVDAPPKVEAPKPPEPKVEPPKPPPPQPEVAKPEPPKPEPQKVEPPKPQPPKQVAKPQPAKPEPKPKADEAVLAKKVVPPAAKPAPVPPPQPAPQPKVQAKAADKAAKEAAAVRARDERIEAAIKRMEQQMGKRGAGTGTKPGEQPGGPISVGPGEGAGGTVRGVEYLLYYNQMINRIKQVWAWAGANRTLEAAVRFNITESGDVVNVRISRPSGDASYDASVDRAVRAANPLPPPPESYRKEFSDVELIFRPEDLRG